MAFRWNEEKNAMLKRERGISFERVVVAVEAGHLLDVLEHPNPEKYQGQKLMVVNVDDYAICVPMVQEADGGFFLKTLFPSRRYTKLFNLEGSDEPH